jgi:hypothetical protein
MSRLAKARLLNLVRYRIQPSFRGVLPKAMRAVLFSVPTLIKFSRLFGHGKVGPAGVTQIS